MSELFNIKGRKAIVTGGSRGIGRGVTEALVAQGADVAIVVRASLLASPRRWPAS